MNTYKVKYPLFGIIYNWKGLKEENYLYTADELKQFDEGLYKDCINNEYGWCDSKLIECAWKTWMGLKINDDEELYLFLSGYYNDDSHEDDDEWYWENVEDNDLYGVKSDTMKIALRSMGL